MKDGKQSKLVEYHRYNERSQAKLAKDNSEDFIFGSKGIPLLLREPYAFYENSILENTKPGYNVLDVCCGDGMLSIIPIQRGGIVTVSDIAEKSVELTIKRARDVGIEITGVAGDAEKLPLIDNSYDMITCAGSISYVDIEIFLNEVRRLLKPNGIFIAVDSFNHNPIYRINRFFHYVKGERSWLVNQRIPNNDTIQKVKKVFKKVDVNYFGIFTFLSKPLQLLLGENLAYRWLSKADKIFSRFKRYSFKIVIIAHK